MNHILLIKNLISKLTFINKNDFVTRFSVVFENILGYALQRQINGISANLFFDFTDSSSLRGFTKINATADG